MKTSHNPRASFALRRYAGSNRVAGQSLLERLLRFMGANTAFADDIFGDLAEERAWRAGEMGDTASRLWYHIQTIRVAPHLVWNAIHHGGAPGRARVAVVIAAFATMLTIITQIVSAGPPAARLEVDAQGGKDGIVVNSTHPVQLSMLAFDAEGERLPARSVYYRWLKGEPVRVSHSGVVTCSTTSDAVIRASVRGASSDIPVHCMPVKKLEASTLIQMTAGDPARRLDLSAYNGDGVPVNRLAGEVRVRDTSVARFANGLLRPLSPGRTTIIIQIGDATAQSEVRVQARPNVVFRR